MKKGKPMRYKLWLVLFLLSATQAEAGLRQYSATLDQSTWALKQNSPLVCELSHPVPHFGEAFFRSMAGKELNMQFELNMLRLPDHYDFLRLDLCFEFFKQRKQNLVSDDDFILSMIHDISEIIRTQSNI